MLLACFIQKLLLLRYVVVIRTKISERGMTESSEITYQSEISLLEIKEHEQDQKEEGLEI